MNIVKRYGGLALIVIGAILFLLEHLNWLAGNWVLLAGLFCIIAGIVTHILLQKRGGKY